MNEPHLSTARGRYGTGMVALTAALGCVDAGSVWAQEDLAGPLEEIVTIGTRVSGRTNTETSVPVDVIGADAIANTGFVETGQLLQALAPSFNFSRTQISDGSDLFRPATLRGLGPDQLLVLINGKRRHTRSVLSLSGTVGEGAAGTDFNAIPSVSIGRIEILRDGAAAQYGSDAIAGVVNIVLKDTVNETRLNGLIGQTYEGDGEQYQLQLNTGFELGDAGFVNLTAEYRNGGSTNRADVSPFFGDTRFQIGDADTEFYSVFYNAAVEIFDGIEAYSFGGYSFGEAVGAGFYRFQTQPDRAIPQAFPEGFLPRDVNETEDVSFALGVRGDIADGWTFDTSVVYGENDYELFVRDAPNISIGTGFLNNNPGATLEELLANIGPTSGFSGGLKFQQLTVNADVTGALDVGLPAPLNVAAGIEYRDETYEIRPGQLASFSCGLSPDLVAIPSILDPAGTLATCGFQAFPGFRPEVAGRSERDSYAVYVDLEADLTDWLRVGAAGRYENYSGGVGDQISGKGTVRAEVTDQFALRGAVSTGFRAPSLQQLGFTTVATSATAAGLTEVLLAPVGSEFPGFFGIDNLDIETSTSFSAGFVWEPLDDLTITVDAFLINIDDRIVLGNAIRPDQLDGVPAAQQFLIDNQIGAANFFSNAIDTRTRGIDIIISHDTNLFGGQLNTTLAANLNKTTVEAINAPAGVDPRLIFPEPSERFVERGQPRQRVNLTFNYLYEKIGSVLRLNYFGNTETSFFTAQGLGFPQGAIDFLGLDDSAVIRPGDALLVDLELSYQVTDFVRLAVGGNNIFDKKPDELPDNAPLRFISSDPSGAFGNVRFPLRGLAYGLNGGFYYARVNFSF